MFQEFMKAVKTEGACPDSVMQFIEEDPMAQIQEQQKVNEKRKLLRKIQTSESQIKDKEEKYKCCQEGIKELLKGEAERHQQVIQKLQEQLTEAPMQEEQSGDSTAGSDVVMKAAEQISDLQNRNQPLKRSLEQNVGTTS